MQAVIVQYCMKVSLNGSCIRLKKNFPKDFFFIEDQKGYIHKKLPTNQEKKNHCHYQFLPPGKQHNIQCIQ